jgi:hypothetical protein
MDETIKEQTEKIYKVYRDTVRLNVKELNSQYVKVIKTIYKDKDNNAWLVVTISSVS